MLKRVQFSDINFTFYKHLIWILQQKLKTYPLSILVTNYKTNKNLSFDKKRYQNHCQNTLNLPNDLNI